MKTAPLSVLIFVLISTFLAAQSATGAVTLTEQQITIPTYLIGPPDPNPQFYFGGGSQGAQHRIYPYPAYDNLTTEKADKSYKIVYLENEYIKIGVLPESGGKIFEAIDKTNGYNFFYRQHVIKPALISLLGAWISGGVEWDVPHHHRATSFLPVQYTTTENPDGSKSVWVGELELRDRMRWSIGLTLHPGKSYLEASFRMINRTPVPVSMLCFSNVAVHVDDTYQVIFPPSTQHVTYHGKRSFTTWPIATTVFNNTDFSAGVDVSWYKAHYNSNSMFAWNYQDDFFAGYDHGKNAGTMSIADHNVVPGKKFWTWGKGPNGLLQDTLLTDSDGPYIELMVGAYSDNQPDYTWLAPYETRMWTQYWYPFRDIDGVKMANTDAAVNLEVKDGKARVGFYATSERPQAIVSLKLKDQVLLRERIAINPGKPYTNEIALPAGTDEHDLRTALSADGKELVAYSPIRLQPESMPSVVTNYPPLEQIKSNEELYLTGLRIDQFRTPGLNGPDAYWNEALKRDPGDVRVNTALAINDIKGGRYADAEKRLRKALERATDRYTMPKDGEPFYYLGLALKAQGKVDEAFTQFSKATWSAQWKGAGYFEMAQIASLRADNDAALTYADQALNTNAANTRALGLKAALLRALGKQEESNQTVAGIAAIDPLDVCIELERIMGAIADLQRRPSNTRAFSTSIEPLLTAVLPFPNACQEAVADCVNAGRWNDAAKFLNILASNDPNNSKPSPMLLYALAYCQQQSVESDFRRMAANHSPSNTNELYLTGSTASSDFAFPFQMEMIPVLEAAMAANPKDSRAPYYLGNLLFDSQPDRAVALWKKSADLGADFPVVYRNLALMYTRTNSPTYGITRDNALAYLEKAAQYGGNAMVFAELDRMREENGVPPEARLALIEGHPAMMNRDDIISRQVTLDIFAGKYDQALSLIKSRFFRAWEGGGRYSLGDSWVNANLLHGRQLFAAKKYPEALAAYQSALVFPTTLGEAIGGAASREAEVNYFAGCAYEAMGDMDKARTAWRLAAGEVDQSAAPQGRAGRGAGGGSRGGRGGRGGGRGGATGGQAAGVSVPQAASYYQARALEKLGQPERANRFYQQLLDAGLQVIASESEPQSLPQRIRVADARYLIGLGYNGLGDKEKAKLEFTAALQTAPDHLAAKVALSDLK